MDIRRLQDAPLEADPTVAINVGNQHCEKCMADPEAECETERQIIVLRVEALGGEV